MIGFIYKIENIVNRKLYIGSTTKTPNRRFTEHLCFLNRGNHCNKHLQNAFNKYGCNSFKFEVLEKVNNFNNLPKKEFCKKLINRELEIIISSGAQYNICKETPNGKLGKRPSEEQKTKVSLLMQNRKMSPESIEKIKKARAKQVITEEHKRKISESLKGKKKNTSLRVYTEEQTKVFSERVYDFHKRKIGCHSEEAKKKRTETIKQLFRTDEMKQKFSKLARDRYNKEFVCKKNGELVGTFTSQIEAADILKIKKHGISSVLTGAQKTHRGYTFEYIK